MGPRQDCGAFESRLQGHETEQLSFFTAHDVFAARFALADAREDPRREPSVCTLGADGPAAELSEIGGCLEIRRLHPTLPSAGHAADDDIPAGEPITEKLAENARI